MFVKCNRGSGALQLFYAFESFEKQSCVFGFCGMSELGVFGTLANKCCFFIQKVYLNFVGGFIDIYIL